MKIAAFVKNFIICHFVILSQSKKQSFMVINVIFFSKLSTLSINVGRRLQFSARGRH